MYITAGKIIENETKLEILMAFSNSNWKILDAIKDLQARRDKERLIQKEADSLFKELLGLVAVSEDYRVGWKSSIVHRRRSYRH